MTEAAAPAVHFSATLVPHRSLSPQGFRWLIKGAIAANLAIGLPMLAFGAWPVLGFMGLDIWLLWWLFKRSYLDARRRESLTLTDRELAIERVAPGGERERYSLDAYWLRVDWDDKEERLIVASRGNRAVIGRFLAPAERRALAEQLAAALAAMRAPRYRHDWDL
ncbi:MAG: DUF2244 domain-containing protein [Alphaproteobacteria bacterium]|nr:DUF2244 domain-containing protein [Alphaproteobacteria bacterium]